MVRGGGSIRGSRPLRLLEKFPPLGGLLQLGPGVVEIEAALGAVYTAQPDANSRNAAL